MTDQWRYLYSVVRYVPDVARGEYVNVAVIVGRDGEGWLWRHADDLRRAQTFGSVEGVAAVLDWLAHLGELSEARLTELVSLHRGVNQLSPPAPVLAESVEQALDVVFSAMIYEAVRLPGGP